MISTRNVNAFLNRYGSQVSLAADGTHFNLGYRAFIQPLRYKNKMYLEGIRTRVGYVDQSHYLYVGPGNVDVVSVRDQAMLELDGARYWFSHAEAVRLADETLYMWAVLRAVVEEE